MDNKVHKREYLKRVTKRAQAEGARVTQESVTKVYEAMVEEIMEIACRGDSLTLSGFGRFYVNHHNGHQVQFTRGEDGEMSTIPAYSVLKFSAISEINRRIGAPPGGGR